MTETRRSKEGNEHPPEIMRAGIAMILFEKSASRIQRKICENNYKK